MRAFSSCCAGLFPFRISASSHSRSSPLSRTTYFFTEISFAAIIASVAHVATKANHQILSIWLKRPTRGKRSRVAITKGTVRMLSMAASKCASLTSQSHLSLPPRRADDAAARDFGNLACDGARGPGGARYHDAFTGFDLADLVHSEIRRQPVEPEQAQRKVGQRAGSDFVHTAEVLAVGHDVVLPAEIAPHDIARLEVGMTRFDHLSDGERLHDIAELNRGLVGSARHPDALRRIDRQPQSPDQHLSVRGLRHRCLIPAKLIPGQLADRTSAQDPLA